MNTKNVTQTGGLKRSSKLKRRDLLRSGAFIGAALASANLFGVRKASAQAVTMRLGSDSPLGDEHNVGFIKLKEEVEGTTNGRIKVVIFPDAQLGSNEAMNNAMKAGTLDGVMSDVPTLSVAVPEMDLFSLPFLFTDTAHALRAANGSVGAKLKPKIERAFGCAVLGFGTDGARNMWNSKRPIRVPDDLKGLKMRVQSSPNSERYLCCVWSAADPDRLRGVVHRIANGRCRRCRPKRSRYVVSQILPGHQISYPHQSLQYHQCARSPSRILG